MRLRKYYGGVKLLTACLLLFISGNAFAGETHYFKANLAGKTGEGKVYGSSTDVIPKETDYKEAFDVPEWKHTPTSAKDFSSTSSLYLYAQPESGYVLKNWTMGDQSVGLDNKTLAPIQGYEKAKTVNYVANFVSSNTPLGKYYRVKNVSTDKYVGLVNNKQLDYYDLIANVGGGLGSAVKNIEKIYQALGENYIGTDINMVQDDDLTEIGDILFLRDASSSQYDVVGQGTSLNHLAQGTYPGNEYITFYNNFAKFTKRDAGYYLVSLKPNCDNSMGNKMFTDCYFYENTDGKFALDHKKLDNETDEYHWQMEPVDYFCVKPLSEDIKDGLGYYWTTLVTAFPYQIPADGGVLGAYTVKQIAAGDDNKNYAKLETLASPGETVPAGTPVLLKMRSFDPSKNKLIPVGNEFISSTNKVTKNLLSGVFLGNKEKNNTTQYRVLNVSPTTGKIGFFKLSSSVNYMGANKAFLELPAAAAKGTVYIDFDNIDAPTTGINNVQDQDAAKGKVVYDLQGRRVENPQHGVYIVNGKKVVIK